VPVQNFIMNIYIIHSPRWPLLETLNEWNHLQDQGIFGKTVLKMMLKNRIVGSGQDVSGSGYVTVASSC
jgi:hypothetical protein